MLHAQNLNLIKTNPQGEEGAETWLEDDTLCSSCGSSDSWPTIQCDTCEVWNHVSCGVHVRTRSIGEFGGERCCILRVMLPCVRAVRYKVKLVG